MKKKRGMQRLLSVSLLILSSLLPACGSAPSPVPEVEGEIVEVLLVRIVRRIQMRGSAEPQLVVWSPVQGSLKDPGSGMDITDPIRVWWFKDGQRTEASDPVAAIEQFQQEQMPFEPYGLYDFGIVSIQEDGKRAQVYSGFDCGGLDCHGQSTYFSLGQNAQGVWEQVYESVWIIELELINSI